MWRRETETQTDNIDQQQVSPQFMRQVPLTGTHPDREKRARPVTAACSANRQGLCPFHKSAELGTRVLIRTTVDLGISGSSSVCLKLTDAKQQCII